MIHIQIDSHPGEGKYKTFTRVIQGLLINGMQAPCHIFVYDRNADMKGWKVFDDLRDVPVHYVDLRPCVSNDGIEGERLRKILYPFSDTYSPTVVVFGCDKFPLGNMRTSSGDLYWRLLLQDVEEYCDERWGIDHINPVYLLTSSKEESVGTKDSRTDGKENNYGGYVANENN